MVSPGWLRTLAAISETTEGAVEPEIDRQGAVTYPFVTDRLDDGDGTADDVLEAMAERSLLAEEFVAKVYVCPDCRVDGMQYSTACPNCDSLHAIQTDVAVHRSCGTVLGPLEAADADEAAELACPECDTDVEKTAVAHGRRYQCRDCSSWTVDPVHRLRCRACGMTCPPDRGREKPLYRYPVSDHGRRWIDAQLQARQSLVETFDARGYETAIDTAVRTADGEPIPVHLVAEDDLLDDRIVAGVHETPTLEDVDRLAEAAQASGARPVVLSTDGALDESVARRVDEADVTVLTADDDRLAREYDVVEDTEERSSMLERIASIFEPHQPGGPS